MMRWQPLAGVRVGVAVMIAIELLAPGVGRGATGATPPSPRTHAAEPTRVARGTAAHVLSATPKAATPKAATPKAATPKAASPKRAARSASAVMASAPGRAASAKLRPVTTARPQSQVATVKIGSALSGSAIGHRAGSGLSLGGPAAYDAKRGAVIGGTVMRPKPR